MDEPQADGYAAADRIATVRLPGGQALLLAVGRALPPGTPVRLRVQARDVSLALAPPAAASVLNLLPARVLALHGEPAGQVLVALDATGMPLLARITGPVRPHAPAWRRAWRGWHGSRAWPCWAEKRPAAGTQAIGIQVTGIHGRNKWKQRRQCPQSPVAP
ncbi:hypothetical protein [Paracidovorax cattleyae]|uniref:Uncharacterized protein n=1 Tax=Paracidovorax cattleyae TaxID=80868 RepID=A0A1H0NGJ4_9BURK|nr:hypothetical protein SAMN04489708_1053 [Paracidovorax cattleyae]